MAKEGVAGNIGFHVCPFKPTIVDRNESRDKIIQLAMILDCNVTCLVLDFREHVFMEASVVHAELARGERQLKADRSPFYEDMSLEVQDET